MSVESFPHFNGPARQRWESIPANTRQLLLANVWCCQCRYSVTITDFSGAIQDGNLILKGKCSKCRGEVT
ncbi:MAG: hypothetical protein ACYDDD_04070, partial [Acidithiobacillus ferrivorans]